MLNEQQLKNFQKKYVINPVTNCWEWVAYQNENGYGQFGLGGRIYLSHRLSYANYVGEIPEGQCVLHRCDVPSCVNPEHLFLGSHQDNMTDMVTKGRQAKGESASKAKLTKKQVLEIRNHPKYRGSGNELANKFGVSSCQISCIRSGKRWSHV